MSYQLKTFEKSWTDEKSLKHQAVLDVFLTDEKIPVLVFSYLEISQVTRDIVSGFCYAGKFDTDVKKHFPEAFPFLKWHGRNLASYAREGLYFSGNTSERKPDFEKFKIYTVWPDCEKKDFELSEEEIKPKLENRLPELKEEFRKAKEFFAFGV